MQEKKWCGDFLRNDKHLYNGAFLSDIMRMIRKVGKYLMFYLSDPRHLFVSEKIGVTNDGLRLWCLRENYLERTIMDTGAWEPIETDVVKRHVHSGCVAFDIGANIGYFTLLMSKLAGETGQVHCFEPTLYGFNRLKRNIEINPGLPSKNIILNNKGLSSRCESTIESLESRFSSKVLAHNEKELIEFITLDRYVALAGLGRVDFIKIDVDGYDYEVVKGGAEIIKKYKPTIMAEICNRVLKERGVNVDLYLELYRETGYSTCKLLETGEITALEEFIKDSRIQSGSWNVLLS